MPLHAHVDEVLHSPSSSGVQASSSAAAVAASSSVVIAAHAVPLHAHADEVLHSPSSSDVQPSSSPVSLSPPFFPSSSSSPPFFPSSSSSSFPCFLSSSAVAVSSASSASSSPDAEQSKYATVLSSHLLTTSTQPLSHDASVHVVSSETTVGCQCGRKPKSALTSVSPASERTLYVASSRVESSRAESGGTKDRDDRHMRRLLAVGVGFDTPTDHLDDAPAASPRCRVEPHRPSTNKRKCFAGETRARQRWKEARARGGQGARSPRLVRVVLAEVVDGVE